MTVIFFFDINYMIREILWWIIDYFCFLNEIETRKFFRFKYLCVSQRFGKRWNHYQD